MPEKKKNVNELIKGFWALPRNRQESFLKEVFALSSQNKDLFRMRLSDEDEKVFDSVKKEMHKETFGRIGKYRKLRLSKINEILRNAEKYAFPMYQQIELRRETWNGMLAFVMSKRYLPDRYEAACARHLEMYLNMVRMHILEKSEQEDIFKKEKLFLENILSLGHQLDHITDVYINFFSTSQ